MTDLQENKIDYQFILQFFMCCLIAVVFLSSTYLEFSGYAYSMHNLKNKIWVKTDLVITPKMQIEVFHYRNHLSDLKFKENQETIFSKSCNGQLELICKYVEKREIQIISLNFYTYLDDNTKTYNEFLINTISFKDKQGQMQLFPYMSYPPSSPQYIAEIKTDFRSFFTMAFIKHLFFALMFLMFNMSFNIFKKSINKLINYLIIAAFSVSFLTFVIRYLLI